MAKQISKFLSNDGTEFATEHEANAHDESLAAANSIEAYFKRAGYEKAQAGLLRKAIPGYLAFLKDPAAGELIAQVIAEREAAEAAEKEAKAKARAEAKAAAQAAAQAAEADKQAA